MNNRRENNPEEFLDLLVDDIRNEPVDTSMVEDRSSRVWERIAKQTSRANRLSTCEDFQALIPAYRDGTLAPGRRMLLEDHSHQCVNCRKVVFSEPEAAPAKLIEMPTRRMTRSKWMGIAAAGLVAVMFGRYGYEQLAPAPGGSRAVVQSVAGNVYRLADAKLQPVAVGAAFEQNEILRTTAGSRAVLKLMDGSVMEVGERAELRVSASRRDLRVHLDRGAVIVQAAKRSEGNLFVATGDSRVAVTGTVFSVNRGAKGTRVSVVEGEVIVEHRREDKILHSGDQLATDRSMVSVPIDQEIAWSSNATEHLKLLKDMASIKESLQSVRMPGVRYSSALLDQAPANAVVFLSIPNMRDAFADAQRLMSSELRRAGSNSNLPVLEFVDRIGKFSEYLGEEFILAVVQNGRHQKFVGIAELHRPGLKDFLDKEAMAHGELNVVEGDQPLPAATTGDGLTAVIRGNKVVFGSDANLINAAFTGNTGFSATPFGQRISQAFRDGTGILLAVDLHSIIKTETSESDKDFFSRTGADGVRYVIAEQKTFNGSTQHSAVLNFDGPRQGLASWLAAPGPMGGLGFVSPNAQFAASVITKNPRQLVEELLALLTAQGERAELDRIQQLTGVNIMEDIAASLGSEATVAIDGPLLPIPSWKAVIEVNQPERLQQAIAKMVTAANTEMQRLGRAEQPLKLETENATQGGGVFYHLSIGGTGQLTGGYYTYRDGYLIAGPTKELVLSAIQNRDAGVRLDTSSTFRRLLPRDQNANFSALVYQNAQESLKFLSNLAGEQQESARELAEKIGPTMIGAYASEDRIQVTTFGSSMDLLMQTAFAPMFHGHYEGNKELKKRGTTKTAAAYR